MAMTKPLSEQVRFTQEGAGAVERLASEKLKEWVSVKDFGAIGDAVADDSSAIEAALASFTGSTGTLYFPRGFYRITHPIIISANRRHLIGDGAGQSVIVAAHGNDSALIFRPADPMGSATLDSCSLRDISLTRSTPDATAGYAIELIQNNGFTGRGFGWSNFANGLLVAGGQNNTLDRFTGFSLIGAVPAIAGSAMLRFKSAPRTSGGNAPCYTVQVSNFNLSGTTNKTVQDVIAINSADGLNFSNGYVNFGSQSLLRLEPTDDGSAGNITATAFSNVYFDCVNTSTGTPNGVYVPNSAFTGTVAHVRFGTGCFIGNGPGVGILGDAGAKLRGLFLTGVNISGFGGRALDVVGETGTNGLRLVMTGCVIRSTSNGVRVDSGRQVLISGTSFADISGTDGALNFAGTIGLVALTGNTFNGTNPDLVNTATVTTFTLSGNASANGTNSLVGLCPGNRVSADPLVLDWYEENEFTPTITFSGNSAGVTYAKQVGRAVRIGRRVFFSALVELTNKGSSTGELRIASLPWAGTSALSQPVSVRINNVANDLGANFVSADVLSGSSHVRISRMNTSWGTEFAAPITDADVTSTFTVNLSGSYEVDE